MFIVNVSKTAHSTPRLPDQTCCAGTPSAPLPVTLFTWRSTMLYSLGSGHPPIVLIRNLLNLHLASRMH